MADGEIATEENDDTESVVLVRLLRLLGREPVKPGTVFGAVFIGNVFSFLLGLLG